MNCTQQLDFKGNEGSLYITISPIDRTFSFEIDYGTGGITSIYTVCDCVTEVFKRLWNTWVPKTLRVSDITYTFPIDGPATKEVTLVCQDYDPERVLQYCTDVEVGVFTKRLISLTKQVMRRNAKI